MYPTSDSMINPQTSTEKQLMSMTNFRRMLKKSRYNSADLKGAAFKAWYTALLLETQGTYGVRLVFMSALSNDVHMRDMAVAVVRTINRDFYGTTAADIESNVRTWCGYFLDKLTLKELYDYLEAGDRVWFEKVGFIHNKLTGQTKDKIRFVVATSDPTALYVNISESVADTLGLPYDTKLKAVVLDSHSPYSCYEKIARIMGFRSNDFEVYEQR